MEKDAIEVATPRTTPNAVKKRQSFVKSKNFEAEVRLILSQDESEEETTVEPVVKVETPKRRKRTATESGLQPHTPKSNAVAHAEQLQTPRRSSRKSIKPAQDYEDIVSNKTSRSLKNGEKQSSWKEEILDEEKEPKWTPAKVGRVSQKRKLRKSRRTVDKKEDGAIERIAVDGEVLEVIANDEDENKENVEPQELLRNRKSPKDNDSKAGAARRSLESVVSSAGMAARSSLEPVIALEEKLASSSLESVNGSAERAAIAIAATGKMINSSLQSVVISVEIVAKNSVESMIASEDKEELNDQATENNDAHGPRMPVPDGDVLQDVEIELPASSDSEVEEEIITIETAASIKQLKHQAQKDEFGELGLVQLVDDEEVNTVVAVIEEKSVAGAEAKSVAGEEEKSVAVAEGSDSSESVVDGEVAETNFNVQLIERCEAGKMVEESKSALDTTFNQSEDCIIISLPEVETRSQVEIKEKCQAVEMVKEYKSTLDTTFNGSEDCIMFSPEVDTSSQVEEKQEQLPVLVTPTTLPAEDFMQTLLVSDDDDEGDHQAADTCSDKKDSLESPSAKIPKIHINDQTPLKTPKNARQTKINIVTPIVSSSCTSKSSKPKPYRFPTPYKSRDRKDLSFEFNIKQSDATLTPTTAPKLTSVLKLTTMEPRQIVLRSIRKRSVSLSSDMRPQKKNFNRVRFHSPANQTAVIEELDLIIARSAKKGFRDEYVPNINNVTKRRKRSLSVDASMFQAHQAAALPVQQIKLRSNTPQKQQPRTKIPNFAAIHQRQFQKMENLVDHVTRKAERAKILTSSGTKLRTVSAQKASATSNNQNIEPIDVTGANEAVFTHARVGRPKALKKIDMSENATKTVLPTSQLCLDNDDDLNSNLPNLVNPRLIKNLNVAKKQPLITQARVVQPKATKKIDVSLNVTKSVVPTAPLNSNDEDGLNSNLPSLPNPRQIKNLNIVQPMQLAAKKPPTMKIVSKTATQIQTSKPAFNLSTHVKSFANTTIMERSVSHQQHAASSIKSTSSTCTTTTQSLADKVASRRQRHMDMFKGRNGRTGADNDKSSEIIRGVRSNRRFDLQMLHRKNLN